MALELKYPVLGSKRSKPKSCWQHASPAVSDRTMNPVNNSERLLDAGISPGDLVVIANGAVSSFDANRKPKGAQGGPVGRTGCRIVEAMLRTEDYEPDPSALFSYTPYTLDGLAERMAMSSGGLGSAVNRLIENGFADKRRNGRSFALRLILPDLALTEYGERHIDAWKPNMLGYHEHQHLAVKMLEMYPRP